MVGTLRQDSSSNGQEQETAPELRVFFMNTTKLEKIAQLNAQAQNRNYPVLFLPVSSLGEPAHSPEEVTGTFKGNMQKKLASCANHLSQFDYGQVIEALQPLGISQADVESKRIRLYGCAEDSGMSFDRGHPEKTKEFVDTFFDTSSSGPYKTDADKAVVRSLERFVGWEIPVKREGEPTPEPKRKPFPGVETVRIMGAAGGVDNFFRLTELAMKKLDIPTIPLPRSKNRLDFIDDSQLGAFEWKAEQGKDFVKNLKPSDFILGDGVSKSTYHSNAHKEKQPLEVVTYSKTIPLGRHSRGETLSREELGPLYQPQARGKALGELIGGIEQQEAKSKRRTKAHSWEAKVSGRKDTLAAQERTEDYRVSVLPADGEYAHRSFARAVEDAVKSKRMNVQVPEQDRARTRVWSELGLFQHMLDASDAVVFLPSGADKKRIKNESKDHERNLEQQHAASQFLEHVTLYPHGKPKLGVFVEEKAGDYEKFIKPFTELHNRGAFGDRPTKLILKASSVDEGMNLLDQHRKQYRPVLTHPEQQSEAPLLKDPHTFHVCVFLSASMEGLVEDKAYALGERIKEAGMGLTYGAADRNAMGAVFKGFLEAKDKHNHGAVVLGSTTHVIAATECEHGTKPKDLPEEHFYLAPSIPKRKEFLFKNSDALVVLEGGVGTLDEMMTYMYYKKHDPKMVEGKPMIICESAYQKGSMYKKALDDYFGCDSSKVDAKTQKAKGIYIVKPTKKLPEGSIRELHDYDIDAAMEILERTRQNGWSEKVRRDQASSGAALTH